MLIKTIVLAGELQSLHSKENPCNGEEAPAKMTYDSDLFRSHKVRHFM